MRANEMTASAAAAAIRDGELSAEQLVQACLDRIAQTEDRVGAWTYLDPVHALEQALAADRLQRGGATLGPLHGLPVGIKDIFDTADMPTENGTVLHAGRRPAEDATVVALLRAAGAVILGKTVTAELAVYAPGKTTNPHDARRTPGGSSSGSAAAVAAAMVPLAVGTQTNGSVLRPASYCGVHGYKPSHGSISRHGVLKQSTTLDQVGVFARSVDDVALIAGELFRYDGKDPDVRPDTRLSLTEGRSLDAGAPLRIAFVKTPLWPNATETAQQAFTALAARCTDVVREVELPPVFESAVACHRTIMESDLANNYGALYASGKERLSDALREMIERGQRYTGAEYSKARDGIAQLSRALDDLFAGCDAVMTPATTGVAPLGLASTGSPMFCTIWTLCGVPAISLPILHGEEGMPLGVQLVAARRNDAQLLRIAKRLEARCAAVAVAVEHAL
ncbi:MAG: amidase [Ramlibacter sp.]